jgi:hypothetical protein
MGHQLYVLPSAERNNRQEEELYALSIENGIGTDRAAICMAGFHCVCSWQRVTEASYLGPMKAFGLFSLLLLHLQGGLAQVAASGPAQHDSASVGTLTGAAFGTATTGILYTDYMPGKYVLEPFFHTRQGSVDLGGNRLWGIDSSSDVQIGLRYGLGRRLYASLSRTRQAELLDMGLGLALYRQRHGRHPFTLTYRLGISATTQANARQADDRRLYDRFLNRLLYTNTLIISRRIRKWSFLASPMHLHINVRDLTYPDAQGNQVREPNDYLALGLGMAYQPATWLSLQADYLYSFSGFLADNTLSAYQEPISLSTVFHFGQNQIWLTASNVGSLHPRQFIRSSPSSWEGAGWRLGLGWSYSFRLRPEPEPLKFEWSDDDTLTPG